MATSAKGERPSGMRVIVFAVDGSEASQAALEYAASKVLNAKSDFVILLHARPKYDPSDVTVGAGELSVSHRAQDVLDRASDFLKSKLVSLQIEVRLAEGDPREVIKERAAEDGADLIIVGCQGKTAFQKLRLGSVSEHLAHHSPCPVLIYRK